MVIINIWNILWESCSGGPSPDGNQRVELFLQGCKKAYNGNPCRDCFNKELWAPGGMQQQVTPYSVAKRIIKFAPNKYITIVGGEPTDQMPELIQLCCILKDAGFHIIVFTHLELKKEKTFLAPLLRHIDILIDGEYDDKQRIFEEESDNSFSNVVGSANQIVWDVKAWQNNPFKAITGYRAGNIETLYLKANTGDLVYILTRIAVPTIEEFMEVNQYGKAIGC